MTDSHDLDDPMFSVNVIHNPKSPDAIFPEALKFPLKRLTGFRIGAEPAKGCPDSPLDVGMEMANGCGDLRRDIRPKRGFHPARFLTGTNGSPNTSSKDNPLPPLA